MSPASTKMSSFNRMPVRILSHRNTSFFVKWTLLVPPMPSTLIEGNEENQTRELLEASSA